MRLAVPGWREWDLSALPALVRGGDGCCCCCCLGDGDLSGNAPPSPASSAALAVGDLLPASVGELLCALLLWDLAPALPCVLACMVGDDLPSASGERLGLGLGLGCGDVALDLPLPLPLPLPCPRPPLRACVTFLGALPTRLGGSASSESLPSALPSARPSSAVPSAFPLASLGDAV